MKRFGLACLVLCGLAVAQPLETPDTFCSGAADRQTCMTEYVAERLYERHAVDVGAASVLGQTGPAAVVLVAALVVVIMTKAAVPR